MSESVTCVACIALGETKPGIFEHASEVSKIRCNVRRFADHVFTVWRCPKCSSLHCKETVDLDEFYAGYPMREQKADFATVRAFGKRLRVMLQHGLKRRHSILDYGSGTALFVDFLKKKGYDAIGYDPYVEQVADRNVLSRAFDFVTSQDVIEHVADPYGSLVEHAQLLKSGGTLCLGTPNASEIALTDEFSMELHPPYHRHILSEKALTDLCRLAKLTPIATYNRFYFDTLFPMVNTQFIKRYIRRTGGFLDAGFEEPRIGTILLSPELLFFGFFGYFWRAPGNMTVVLRKISN